MATKTPQVNSKFARVRAVTLAVLKLDAKGGTPRYILALGPMRESESVDKDKGPATVMHALDMETGEEGIVICPTVLRQELNKVYPGEGYVGKGFEIVLTRVPDKRYNIPTITEVAVPEESEAIAKGIREAASKAKGK